MHVTRHVWALETALSWRARTEPCRQAATDLGRAAGARYALFRVVGAGGTNGPLGKGRAVCRAVVEMIAPTMSRRPRAGGTSSPTRSRARGTRPAGNCCAII